MGYYKDIDNNGEYASMYNIKEMWKNSKISSFEFLLWINIYGNRSFRDISQYPVFPWVMTDYNLEKFEDIINNGCIRNFNLPMGLMSLSEKGKERQEGYIVTYRMMCMDLRDEELVDFKIKDQLIMQFGHSFENVPFEWEKQTITFNTEKSDELSNSDKERVKIERKKRFDTWAVNTETYAFHNGFGYPVSNPSIISSEFGLHRKWVYAKGNPTSDVHTGLDYPDAEGTPIYASADGRVAFAEYATYLGNAVFIDHGLGVYSVYMHNHKLNVAEGDTVKKGDLIAYMGMTGAATGPHCHWEIRIFGMPVDPRSMLFINSIKF